MSDPVGAEYLGALMWVRPLLGWRPATKKATSRCVGLFGEALAPNIADVGSVASLAIAGHVYKQLGITDKVSLALGEDESGTEDPGRKEKSSGNALEEAISSDLQTALPALDPGRIWSVVKGGQVTEYEQYLHLAKLQELFDEQPTLRVTVGRDYQVKPDVVVGARHQRADGSDSPLYLHAAVSSKWTIRSDRVQNVRHEFAMLVRNRRGRSPHLVLVTAEPLPTRLRSIARGTGEVDAVYHLMYEQMESAVADVGPGDQREAWLEITGQGRLRSYSTLAEVLVTS